MENNHSNEEALTCRGFYIREKTSKMVPLSNSESLTDKINNMAVGENAPAAFNGENDKNEEHDKDALKEDHHLILQIESNKNLESLKQNVEKTEEPKTYTKNESKEIYSNIETGKELNTETEDLLIISWNDNVCENLNKEESKSISNIKTTEPNPNEKSSEKITGSSNEVIESKSPSKSQSQLSTCSSSTLDADIDDIDEDFDPSLLCPDISMDVDEVPVVTNENQMPETSSSSPLPYEPIFSTVVDEMTGAEVQVNLTPAEMELRSKMFAESSPVQSRKIHCTACNIHLGSALTGANNRFVHPLLKVLICKNCYHFYTSGEFEKDEDGSELYCRWCGQGGQVLCCSNCEYVFCKKCIRNNFGQRKFKEIRDSDDWSCFKCAPEQLSPLRAFCAEFMDYYRTELVRAQALADVNPTLMSTDYTTCCSGQLPKKEDFKTLNIQKNRKKRKDDDNDEDPDYEPVMEDYEPPNKKFALNPLDATTVNITTPGMRQIAPKISTAIMRPMTGQPIRPQVFNIGNTTFRSQGPVYTMSQSVINPANNIGTTQGFIAVSAKPGKFMR